MAEWPGAGQLREHTELCLCPGESGGAGDPRTAGRGLGAHPAWLWEVGTRDGAGGRAHQRVLMDLKAARSTGLSTVRDSCTLGTSFWDLGELDPRVTEIGKR